MPRPRPTTEIYLAAVEQARASRGVPIDIPKDFRTEFNAGMTLQCLKEGYLRVEPRDEDETVVVRGKRYIKTAGPVEATHRRVVDIWRVSIQA